MVQPITKYLTDDGSEFSSYREAKQHESLTQELAVVMKPLGKRPDSLDFLSGKGYKQHLAEDFLNVQRALVAIAARTIEWFAKYDAAEIHQDSQAGRILDEHGPDCVSNAWARLRCIDDQCREWGQPYYANHPEKGEQIEVG